MKVHKPIILHIPALLVQELNKYLEANQPCFKYDIVYFYYIIHYIIVQQIKNKNNIEYCLNVPINMKNFKAITVSNINDYIKLLINGEFIKSDNQYVKGERSKGYWINEIYLLGVDKIEVKSDCRLFKKIIKYQRRKKTHIDRLEPYLKRMNIELMNIDFDYDNAEKWILSQPDEQKRTTYIISLNQLKDKRFRYFKRNKTNNRLDTNITNLKKDLKQFIIGEYVCIDLKNSQPFFFKYVN